MIAVFGVAATTVLAGCGHRPAERITLAVPDRTNAHATLAADGARVAAAWATSGAAGTDIEFALSIDDGRHFTAPVRVNDVPGEASVSGEQPPRVVLHDAHVDVVWVAKQNGIGVIRTARSTDGGTTFSPARTISPTGATGARGWESAAIADDGSLHVAWLDGRAAGAAADHSGQAAEHTDRKSPQAADDAEHTDRKSHQAADDAEHADRKTHQAADDAEHADKRSHQAPDHAAHMNHARPGWAPRQDIFHAVWTGTEPLRETRVATNVCFCCKTAIVTNDADVFVAWRHLFDGGVRDIAVAHSSDGGLTFGQPVRASADNWKIDACPDDGPAMAIDGVGILHIVWPTLIHEDGRDRMAIFHASSVDEGMMFSPRERVDDGRGVGASHPRIAAGRDGSAAIAWDQLVNGRRHVVVRVLGNHASSAHMDGAGSSSYPSVVATSNGYVLAWSEQTESGSHIVVVRGL
jgi:hypothetical protein